MRSLRFAELCRRSAYEWCVHTTPFFSIYRWKEKSNDFSKIYLLSFTSFFMSFSLNFLSFTNWLLTLDTWFISFLFKMCVPFACPINAIFNKPVFTRNCIDVLAGYSHQNRFVFPFKNIKLIFLINHQVEDAYDQWTSTINCP